MRVLYKLASLFPLFLPLVAIAQEEMDMDMHLSPVAKHRHGVALVAYEHVTHVAIADGEWSDSSIWDTGTLPADDSRVLIPEGLTVLVDGIFDQSLRTIRVDGTLSFQQDVSTQLRVESLVSSETGLLEIGTAENPIHDDVTATIIFDDREDGFVLDSDSADYDPLKIGLGLLANGPVRAYGSAKSPYAVTSGVTAGTSVIAVKEVPSNWKAGDKLVIATDSYHDIEGDEIRYLVAVDSNAKTITIDQPLEQDHMPPSASKPEVQEKLEIHIINLNRNIILKSEESHLADSVDHDDQWNNRRSTITEFPGRGHVMFMHHSDVICEYVEFRHLGRTNLMATTREALASSTSVSEPAINPVARYAMHFHMAHLNGVNRTPGIIRGCAVDTSPGWGYVVHSSHAIVEDCVSYDVAGAAYVAESGDELGAFINNVSIRTITPDSARPNRNNGSGGMGFWLTSTNMDVIDNVASGSSGSGFTTWVEPDHSHSALPKVIKELPAAYTSDPEKHGLSPWDETISPHQNMQNFRGNTAYAAKRHGHRLGRSGGGFKGLIEDFTGWSVESGMDRWYSGGVTVNGLTLVNDVNNPSGTGYKAFHNTGGWDIFNAHIEGFVHGYESSPRQGTSYLYNAYLKNVVNIEWNKNWNKPNKQFVQGEIIFEQLSAEAIANYQQRVIDMGETPKEPADMNMDTKKATDFGGLIDNVYNNLSYRSYFTFDADNFANTPMAIHMAQQADDYVLMPEGTKTVIAGMTNSEVEAQYGTGIRLNGTGIPNNAITRPEWLNIHYLENTSDGSKLYDSPRHIRYLPNVYASAQGDQTPVTIDLSEYFHGFNQQLICSAEVIDNADIASASISGTQLTVTPSGVSGRARIKVSASVLDSGTSTQYIFCDTPGAMDDFIVGEQGQEFSYDVLVNDISPEGDSLQVTDVTANDYYATEILRDGSILFTPTAPFVGTTTLVYTAQDSQNTSYTATINLLSQGLVAYYKMDGSAGDSQLLDSSGNGLHGWTDSPANSHWADDGIWGQSLSFRESESADHFQLPAAIFDSIESQYTITFWTRVDGDTSNQNKMLQGLNSAGQDVFNIFTPYTAYDVRISSGRDDSGLDTFTVKDDMIYDQWQHWSITKDTETGKMYLYLNGEQVGSNSGKNRSVSDLVSLTLGNGCSADIDDLRIYNHILTAERIKDDALGGVLSYRGETLQNGYLADSSAFSQHNALELGASSINDGALGKGIDLTVAGLELPMIDEVKNASNFSISFWMKSSDPTTASTILHGINETGQTVMKLSNSSASRVSWSVGADNTTADLTTAMDSSLYNHWILVKDADLAELRIYQNGVLVAQNSISQNSQLDLDRLVIGQNIDGSASHYALVDELMVYTSAFGDELAYETSREEPSSLTFTNQYGEADEILYISQVSQIGDLVSTVTANDLNAEDKHIYLLDDDGTDVYGYLKIDNQTGEIYLHKDELLSETELFDTEHEITITVLTGDLSDVIDITPTTGRYVRFKTNNKHDNTWVSIREIEVFSEGVNVALNKTIASVSGQQDENPATNIIDGIIDDDANRWSAEGKTNEVVIDLGANYEIDQLHIDAYLNRLYTYTVEIMPEGGEYQQVVNRASVTLQETNYTVTTMIKANQAPVVGGDSYVMIENDILEFDPVANDTDAENEHLTLAELEEMEDGHAYVIFDNTVHYVPDYGFSGFDSIRYNVGDTLNNVDADIDIEVLPRMFSWFNFESGTMDEVRHGNYQANFTGDYEIIDDGAFGKAIKFNGGYASLPSELVAELNEHSDEFAISFWTKFVEEAGHVRLFQLNDGSGKGIWIEQRDSNALRVWIKGDEKTYANVGASHFDEFEWTHFVVQYNGEQLEIYVNGELKNTIAQPAGLPHTFESITFAANSDGNSTSLASFDEIHLYRKSLSANQVNRHFLGEVASYLSYEEYGEDINDISGMANHIHAAGDYYRNYSDFLHSASLTTQSASLHVPAEAVSAINGQFTFASWAKVDEIQDGPQVLFELETESKPLIASLSASGEIVLSFNGSQVSYDVANQVSEWHHYGFTVNGSHASIYLNGLLVAEGEFSSQLGQASSLSAASTHSSSEYWQGEISQLNIFKTTLSAEDIVGLAALPPTSLELTQVAVITPYSEAGEIIATIEIEDFNTTDQHLYELVDELSGTLQIDANTGAISIADASLLPANISSFDIEILLTDPAGYQLSKAYSLIIYQDPSYLEASADLVPLTARDDISSNGFKGSVADTLNDVFDYNAYEPALELPEQEDVNFGFRTKNQSAGAYLYYEVPQGVAVANGLKFVIDLYGRNSSSVTYRDNNIDIYLLAGGADGIVIDSMLNVDIDDNSPYHSRFSFDNTRAFDTVLIYGPDANFTLLEMRMVVIADNFPNTHYNQWVNAESVAQELQAATVDADGDGYNNMQEYYLGTDPNHTSSGIYLPTPTQDGELQIKFSLNTDAQGLSHRWQISHDMVSWTELANEEINTQLMAEIGNVQEWALIVPIDDQPVFYRMIIE
ncbi:LamG-like jellyroll fold domain-containing protein [Persicirhabdus sediminis]|uniref:Cadherin-like domain-containing protein n=1 Tax=Persicirhabdus sediminis TaxID=454144 RepID=A0A8J7MA40_9BACT|nr:LamG-like jellyroll fold domain-containing protein [Persicirhabdus sediminis]MBK1789729.1 cadherin-like domain-containing protein [Persicirhabdus sediminis]